MPEFATFAEWQQAVDQRTAQVWAANGGAVAFDPLNGDLGVSHVTPEDDEESWEVRTAKIETLDRLLDFIWVEGPNILNAMKRLAVITMHVSPKHLKHMNQSDVAVLFNETRAATSARSKKQWEVFLKRKGFFGTRRPLKKGDEAREIYKAKAQGNVNRKGGDKAKKKFSVLRNQTKKSKK